MLLLSSLGLPTICLFFAEQHYVLASPFISPFTHSHLQGSPAEGTGKFDAGPGKHATLSVSPSPSSFLGYTGLASLYLQLHGYE